MDNNSNYPFGRPILSDSDDCTRFKLLRALLHRCDKSHDCNKRQETFTSALPTRVLYVGDRSDTNYNPDLVRLDCPSGVRKEKYTALSHCWGRPSDEAKKVFCTTQLNIQGRRNGFKLCELPKTFQDAVKVTRELGIPYLWVDSLCIIQCEDDQRDWKTESNKMESVFSGAYVTIAATAANDFDTGFLKRHITPQHFCVQNVSGNQFYISTDIDDFDKDVVKAQLNTRAWVMQEAVLSRRTIHFSANQIYWECGNDVYCENLTVLESYAEGRFFMRDPDFPRRLLNAGKQRTWEFISYFIQDYSKRNLTFSTDRCVAIAGLVDRIADSLKCHSRFGIFEQYLHRNLLWQASNDKMEEIQYDRDRRVPSWSWMAYTEDINFLDIPFGYVEWIDHLRFDAENDYSLIANMGEFKNSTLQPDGCCYDVLDLQGTKVGSIQYDIDGGKELCEKQCIVIGRTTNQEKYYVIVVRSIARDNTFRRIGVGWILCRCVEGLRIDVRVV